MGVGRPVNQAGIPLAENEDTTSEENAAGSEASSDASGGGRAVARTERTAALITV